MRRAVLRLLVLALSIAAGIGAAPTLKNVSAMYAPAILEYWQPQAERYVGDLIKHTIEPHLSAGARQLWRSTRVEVPATTPLGDPFDYRFGSRTLTIPVLAFKFLSDLVAAHLWLEAQGFADRSLQYVSVLKYRAASEFPGRRYLSPFEALAIPHNAFVKLSGDPPDISAAYQQIFNGALLFIVAHEAAHALDTPSPDDTRLQQELAADEFAFEMLARNQFNPAGIMWFFLYASMWEPNVSDFQTPAEHVDWRQRQAAHPLSGERLTRIGTKIASTRKRSLGALCPQTSARR